MQHPKSGDIITLYTTNKVYENVTVVEWDNWVRINSSYTTSSGCVTNTYTVNISYVISYEVFSVGEKARPAQSIPVKPQQPLVNIEAELGEKAKSLSELRLEQQKAKLSSIKDFLPEQALSKTRKFTTVGSYELPSFKKYSKNET